jgi:hypothetical protein
MYAGESRSFVRAMSALAISTGRKKDPASVLRALWNDDSRAERVLKAVSTPLDTGSFPAIQSTVVLPMLAPAAASTRLLALGAQLSLDGLATLRLPFIGAGGRPASPAFIGEGDLAPAVDLLTSGAVLGPARKVLILSGISAELEAASGETAEQVISQALATSAERRSMELYFLMPQHRRSPQLVCWAASRH